MKDDVNPFAAMFVSAGLLLLSGGLLLLAHTSTEVIIFGSIMAGGGMAMYVASWIVSQMYSSAARIADAILAKETGK